jgi:predicted small secreted protein
MRFSSRMRIPVAVLAAAVTLLPACGRKNTFEKAGKKADEAIGKAGDAAKEAADRLKATATAAGAAASDTAGRVGKEIKEGSQKVGDVIQETGGNVKREVHRYPPPLPTPTLPPGSKKKIRT